MGDQMKMLQCSLKEKNPDKAISVFETKSQKATAEDKVQMLLKLADE